MRQEVVALIGQITMMMKNHHLNEMEIRLLEDCLKRIYEIVENLEDMVLKERKNE